MLARHAVPGIALLSGLVLSGSAWAQAEIRTLSLSGDMVTPGFSIAQFAGTGPVLNSSGQVIFGLIGVENTAALIGVDLGTGARSLLVAPDARAPFGNFASFDFYSISDDHRIATEAFFVDSDNVGAGYFVSGSDGNLTPAALIGDGKGFDFVLSAATASTGGAFALSGILPNEPFDSAGSIIGGTPGGTIVEIARQGTQVPGLSEGALYDTPSPITVNSQGAVLFSTILRGDVTLLGDDSAVILGDVFGASQPRVVARAGGAAAGLEGRSVIQVGSATLNNAGDLLYNAITVPTGSDPFDPSTTLGSVLYSARQSDEFRPVAFSGQLAAGYDDGTTILDVSGGRITSGGNVGYIATVSGDDGPFGQTETAAFFDRDGQTTRLAYTGQRIASLGEEFSIANVFGERPTVNDSGQAIINATIHDESLDRFFAGLLGVDTDGSLIPIVYEGQLFEVGPGDFREVALILGGSSANEDGGTRTFNDRGQFVFSLVFTDFTQGHFSTVVPAVPSIMLPIALVPFAARRRRNPNC